MQTRIELIENIIKILDRYEGRDSSVYLFSEDFADFKLVNYIYGFERGEKLLNDTVKFLQHVPECVFCERTAIDQFVLIIITDKSRADEEIIATHNHVVEDFLAFQQDSFPDCILRVWSGMYEIRDRNISAAIENADLARREAKKSNVLHTVIFKKTMKERLVEYQKQEMEVVQALEERRFTFYLQPQVDLTTGVIVGAEALARGFLPDGEMILPAVFIPIYEKNGLILDLDYLILEQVCQHIRERLDSGDPVIPISVNLSRLHLRKPNTAEHIHGIAEKYSISPELLTFELTENMPGKFMSAKVLGKRLHELGYKTSIDDFGAGYAGIDVWRNLSFNESGTPGKAGGLR